MTSVGGYPGIRLVAAPAKSNAFFLTSRGCAHTYVNVININRGASSRVV